MYCRKEVDDDRKAILTKAFLDGYNTPEFQKYLADNYIIPLVHQALAVRYDLAFVRFGSHQYIS